MIMASACAVALSSTEAAADCYEKLVEAHCYSASGSGYSGTMTVRTFGTYEGPCLSANDPDHWPEELASQGLYSLAYLKDNPFECSVRGKAATLRISRFKPSLASGMCGGEQDASAVIEIDGVPVLDLASTHGWCHDGSINHTVEVSNRTLRHCEIRHEYVTDDQTPQHDKRAATVMPRTAACSFYDISQLTLGSDHASRAQTRLGD